MIEYKILKEEYARTLAKLVEEHLNHGWKLHGDVKIAPHVDGGCWHLQALTKGNPDA